MSSNYPGPYDQYANTSWDKAQQPRGLDTPVQEILKFQQRQLQHNPGRNAYLPQNQQVNYNTPGIPAATPDATQLLQQAKIILAQANPQLANSANSTNANNQAFRLLQQLTQPQPQQQAAYSAASVGVANRGVFGQQAPLHQYDQRALSADYLSGRQASTQASLYGQAQGQTQARALQYGSGYDDPRNLSAQLSNYPSMSAQSNQGSLFSPATSQSTSRQQASSNTGSGFSSSGSGSRNSNSNSSSRNSNSSASNRDRQRSNNNNNNNSGFRRNDDNGNSGNNNRRNDRRDDPPPRRDDRRDDPPPRREPERAKSPKKETRKRKASPPLNNTSTSKSKPLARSIDTIQKTEFHHSFAVKQIDYLQLKQRHRKLHIPKDFSHVECLCAYLNNEVPTSNFYLDIDCSTKKDESSKIDQILKVDSETASITSDGVVYTSKVMLFAGFKQPYGKSNSHLSNQLKFIVGKKDRSELFCIGGAWSVERDGGDPSVDRSVLKATATHYFKEFTGVDLSVCKEWIHFMDIHYQRPTGTEVSVIWIPCIWQSPLLNNIVSNLASGRDLSASTSSPPAISTASGSAPEPESPTASAAPSADPPADPSTDPSADSSTDSSTDTSTGPSADPSTTPSAIPSGANDAMETSPSPSTVEAPLSSPVDSSIEHGEITEAELEVPMAPEASEGLSSSNTGGSNTSSESSATPTSTTTSTNNTETAADTNNNNSSQSSDTTPTNNATNIPKESSLRDSSSSSRTRINLVTNVPSNVKLKPMSLSLHGLLEYDENDVFEKTFEVSLFGELFNDMLKREFGATILNALDLYSKRRVGSNALTSNEPPTKKQKLDEADTISNSTSNEVVSEEKPLLSTTEDTALLRAMDFFDKHGHGYLRPDEMETILYCLGKSLCKRVVEELVDKVIDPDSGRILYKKMIEDRTLFGHEQF